MPNPVSTLSRFNRPESDTQPVRFSAQGTTLQKAAFYLYQQSWDIVGDDGEQVTRGEVYSFPPGLLTALYKSLAVVGSGRFARAQNLAALQKNTAGRDCNSKIEQAAHRRICEMNSEKATYGTLSLSARLIAMQFQLAGVRFWQTSAGKAQKLGEKIDAKGRFETIGDRPVLATLLSGPNGRPSVLEKRVKFVQALQSEAQKHLAEQIRRFGETSALKSGEDLVHRAKLTLVAAPTEYLRQRHQLAVKICKDISLIESCSHDLFRNNNPAPSQSRVYAHMVANAEFFQKTCSSLRAALAEFGNPIPK